MENKFAARQKMVSQSELERLLGRGSRDVENIAKLCGWQGLSGEPLNVTVSVAVSMLVMSIALNHNIEPKFVGDWLPGLRNEALITLGANISNWSYEGAPEAEQQFWDTLYGGRERSGGEIARLLGCCRFTTTRLLRFHSASDVERLTNSESDSGDCSRLPRFTINARDLANTIACSLSGPLFYARRKIPDYA